MKIELSKSKDSISLISMIKTNMYNKENIRKSNENNNKKDEINENKNERDNKEMYEAKGSRSLRSGRILDDQPQKPKKRAKAKKRKAEDEYSHQDLMKWNIFDK